MFGDISGMMQKLQEAKQKVEETKRRLDTVLIDEGSEEKIKVTITANRELKSVTINESLTKDTEELEDYLIVTLNKALKKASEINEREMAEAAKSGMPNIPGLNNLM